MSRIQATRSVAVTAILSLLLAGLGLVSAGPAQAAPAWWTAYPGVTGVVNVVAVDPLGRTWIGGNFSSVDGMAASDVAMWNGAQWNTLAGGVTSPNVSEVRDIAFDNSGNAYVGGAFAGATGVSSRNIIMWNGTSWQAMGTGTDASSGPMDLLWDATYGLVMGGDFSITVGGVTWFNLAQWQSGTWGRIGGTDANGTVRAMAVLSTGHLVITGDFSSGRPNGCMTYARWDGTTWNCFSEVTSGAASTLVADNAGNFYAGGNFTQTFPSSTPMRHVARWNGTTWTEMGAVSTGLIAGPTELAWVGGTLTAGMSISRQSGYLYTQVGAVQQWDGTAWNSLGGEFSTGVLTIAATASGDVLAGGQFTSNNSNPVNRLARWGEADPTTAPGAPLLTGATPASTSAVVSYTADDTGGAAITRMEFALDDTITVDDSTTQVNGTRTLTNLQSGTTYTVYARAVNYQGAGVWSAPLTFTTLRQPGAPTISGVAASVTSAAVSYTADDTGGAATTRMEFALDDTLTVDDSTTQVNGSMTLANLQPGTTYTVYARAVNSVNPGPWSAGSTFTTLRMAGAPAITSVVPAATSATVNYTADDSGGAAITRMEFALDDTSTVDDSTTNLTSHALTGLVASTGYVVYARAVNAGGAGPWSAGQAFTTLTPEPPGPTPGPVPVTAGAPRDVTATAGSASLTASWSAPLSSGTYPVSSYRATASPGGRSCVTTTMSCTIDGLTNGVGYTVTVRALTGAGWSTASAPSNEVTPSGDRARSIMITGTRGTGAERNFIRVKGATVGIEAKRITMRWTVGSKRAVPATATTAVKDDGTFTWSHRITRAVTIHAEAAGVRSNTITIRASGKGG